MDKNDRTEQTTLVMAEKRLFQFLDFGEMLLGAGAEIRRVEDTLTRMGNACGVLKMNVMVITSNIIITMNYSEEMAITQTRRILNGVNYDLWRVEQLNAMSRRFCKEPLSLETFDAELIRIRNDRDPSYFFVMGSLLAAGSYCLFFGGTWQDGVASMFFGALVCLFQKKLAGYFPNVVIFNFLCAFVTGIGICVAAHYIPVIHVDKVTMGDIMLLIPGLTMTNAVRDMLVGDTMSGILRITESLLWAAALAFGFIAAMMIVRF